MSEKHDSEELSGGSATDEIPVSNDYVTVEPILLEAGNGGGSVDQVDGSQFTQDESSDAKVAEDGRREDIFVDCSEEIETSETRTNAEEKDDVLATQPEEMKNRTQVESLMAEIANLHNKLEETVVEKQSFAQKYEEERATFKGELAHLHYQLKALNVRQSLFDKLDALFPDHYEIPELEDGDEKNLASDASLHEMVTECSKGVESAMGLHSETEHSIKGLHASLQMKDSEIEDLNSKITESSISHEVIISYLNSMQEAASQTFEVQLVRDHDIEEIAKRILASLPLTIHQVGGFLEGSLRENFSRVERSISHLVEKYNQFLSGIDKLKLCLTDITADSYIEDEAGIISSARDKLLEHQKKEVDLDNKLSHFENENMKLEEQVG